MVRRADADRGEQPPSKPSSWPPWGSNYSLSSVFGGAGRPSGRGSRRGAKTRLIRHPGYAGSLLTWTGFALADRSVPVVALVAGLLGWAYRRRITAEEQLLQRDLPGYRGYQHCTKRLVLFLW